MPGMIENSWTTFGILIPVIDVPSIFDKRTRRKAFAMVKPCPTNKLLIKKDPVIVPDSFIVDLTDLNFNSIMFSKLDVF
jgi:hypothetical protein